MSYQPPPEWDLQNLSTLSPQCSPPFTNTSFLPTELIILVIDNLMSIPKGQPTPIAFSASHPITKTLHAFLFTSCTYSVARFYLLTRCLYIDSMERLSQVTRALWTGILRDGKDAEMSVHERFQCNMYPNGYVVNPPREVATSSEILSRILAIRRKVEPRNPSQNRSFEGRQLQHGHVREKKPFVPEVLMHISSLYLAPVPVNTPSNFQQISAIGELLCILSPYLQRLVISIPDPPSFKSQQVADIDNQMYFDFTLGENDARSRTDDWEEKGIKLWGYLGQLHALKLFCNLDGDITLKSVNTPRIMDENWPKIEVLVINTSLSEWNWQAITSLKRIINVNDSSLRWFDYEKFWSMTQKKLQPKDFDLVFVQYISWEIFKLWKNPVDISESGITIRTIGMSKYHNGLKPRVKADRDKICLDYTLGRILSGDDAFL